MGIGSMAILPLADARASVQEYRKLLSEGVDPIEARKAKQAVAAAAVAATSFADCATAYIEAHKPSWRNAKHSEQWTSTIRTYANPVIGKMSVRDVDTDAVMGVLTPIWKTKTETANRLRGRLEAILDWAKVRGFRSGENPARWRGHLDKLLPARGQIQQVRHHPALPYAEVASFIQELRRQPGTGACGLEFQILTAARTGEVIGARWDEIDEEKRIWTVPAERMKAKREHRVALSEPALALLAAMRKKTESEYVFPASQPKRHLSNMAFLQLLKRMNRSSITAHGFRSSFKDWASEQTNFPTEVVEMAMAHTISDKVVKAYQRGDLLQKRFLLADAWGRYCVPAAAVPKTPDR
jgi:integrase